MYLLVGTVSSSCAHLFYISWCSREGANGPRSHSPLSHVIRCNIFFWCLHHCSNSAALFSESVIFYAIPHLVRELTVAFVLLCIHRYRYLLGAFGYHRKCQKRSGNYSAWFEYVCLRAIMAHSSYKGWQTRYLISDKATYVHAGQAAQASHTKRTNLEANARFAPNSQASSLNNSLSSQLSQVRPSKVGDLGLIRPHGAMTLSTPFSDESSQEVTDRPYLVKPDTSTINQNQLINGPAVEDALDQDYTSAPKRMANGEVKSSESRLPTSPVELSQYGHSRNSSRTSRVSQIGEVCHLSLRPMQTYLTFISCQITSGFACHMPWSKSRMAGNHTTSASSRA